MGFTMVGVVMLLSDIAFLPAATVITTAAAVTACAITWWVLPLRRRRALRRRSSLPDPNRLDPILPDRLDADRKAVR